MRPGQKKNTGTGAGSFNGPKPKVQTVITTGLRDRIKLRCKQLGIPVPEYIRRCILNDLDDPGV